MRASLLPIPLVLALASTVAPPLHAQEPVTFPATDDRTVHAVLFSSDFPEPRAMILAFHQGGASGRAEYAPIAERLVAAGYEVLAVDQRVGGDLFGGTNLTATAEDEFTYCEAAPDLAGALQHARTQQPEMPVILWGSSYSAALALRLAAEGPDGVVGVLAFSPASGGPMVDCRGEDVSAEIEVPVLVLRPASEMERETSVQQFETFKAQGHQTWVADPGVHGSSMLVAERVDGSVDETWRVVLEFLEGLTSQ